jgi:hypothetical protein
MPLSDVLIAQIKTMNRDALLRACLTPDAGVVVDVLWRLERTTRVLNGVLIALTLVLVLFTGVLVYRTI